MLIGKQKNAAALLITSFEGYGDLVYHTPTIRVLSKFYKHLDVLCKQPEPFFNNPLIRKISTFDRTLPKFVKEYGKNVFEITINSFAFFPHSNIHTVDLVSIKALRIILRDSEKTLEAYWMEEDIDKVRQLLIQHPLSEKNKIIEGKFVVISPTKTWESRTLPLSFYQQLIFGIQRLGYGIVLVGKDIIYKTGVDINKTQYSSENFPETICLYNQLTFAQLCSLYSMTPITINTENGHHPISCTNDHCWNIFIPSLTAPEYRLPHRHGSQKYKTAIAANVEDYYPASVYGATAGYTYQNMPIKIPTVEHVLYIFESVLDRINNDENFL